MPASVEQVSAGVFFICAVGGTDVGNSLNMDSEDMDAAGAAVEEDLRRRSARYGALSGG